MSTQAERREVAGRDGLAIALALSGGGVRAAVFHLGVIRRMAEDRLLERVTFLSTVSGGSLVAGLIFSLAGERWPTSDTYLAAVLPQARALLTRTDIQREMICRFATRPRLWTRGRAQALADAMRTRWGVTARLGDLPTTPRWVINATAYESGKNWRFTPQRMGDYVLGHVLEPHFPLVEAMAASAAFPGLIGPLVLDARDYAWAEYANGQTRATRPAPAKVPRVHLWDGGVYDNLGVEALFKPRGNHYRDEYNFLVVSDASGGLGPARPVVHQRATRLIAIATDQVRSLRARSLVAHFLEQPHSGVYLRMGNSAAAIYRDARIPEGEIAAPVDGYLSDEEVRAAAHMETTLRRLSAVEFARVCRHGWEVAHCTLRAYSP